MNQVTINRIIFTANAGFSISSVFICICILLSYFFKASMGKNEEKTVYFILDVCSIIVMSIVEIIYVLYFLFVGVDGELAQMFYHLYSITILFISFFSWAYVITYRFSLRPNYEKIKKQRYWFFIIVLIIQLVIGIMIFTMPVTIYAHYGLYTFKSVPITVILVYVLISTILFTFLLYSHNKNLKRKDLYPSIVSLVLSCMLLIYRLITGIDINVESFQLTIFTLGIFFTIENQDYKLLTTARQKQIAMQEADESQKKFLANMSHEIRSPMNTILGLSQLLLKEDTTKEGLHSDVGKIHDASISLLSLINNIIDYSSTISKEKEILEKEYKFEDLIFELNNNVLVILSDTNTNYDFVIDENIPKILLGDEEKIMKIIFDILANVGYNSNVEQVLLNINGSKNKENEFEFIFEITVNDINLIEEKTDDKEDKNLEYNNIIDNSILSFLVAKSFLKMLNGKIDSRYEENVGTIYTINIKQRIVDEAPIGNSVKSVVISANTRLYLEGKKFLVVDNASINIKLIKSLLNKYKPTIEVCDTARLAIEKNKNNNYDAILIADVLNDSTASVVMNQLRKLRIRTPMIVLTPDLSDSVKEKYLSDGFYECLSKPINYVELNKVLYELFYSPNEVKNSVKETNTSLLEGGASNV